MVEANEMVIATALCDDGMTYEVRPLAWTLDKIRDMWNKTPISKTFSDEFTPTEMGFFEYIVNGSSVWYEIVNTVTGEQVGVMYLTDFVQGRERFMSAVWHATVWDAQATLRQNILKEGIAALFRQFRFHRLQAEVPCHFKGTIKIAKRLGFTVEGRVRESRAYSGIWYDSLIMGLLESEVSV